MEARKGSTRRWAVLAAFSASALISQMLWLNFAPILTQIQKIYDVSEGTATLLIAIFPILYIFLSVPAGTLIDKKGYRFSVALGSIIQAIFSCVRIYDSSFNALLIGQIGIAVAQPFIVNGIGRLASEWFEHEQGAIANGLGTVGMFLGMAIALGLTPVMVSSIGMQKTMIAFAIISVIVTIAYVVIDPARPAEVSTEKSVGGYGKLFKNRQLLLLFFLAFIGLGFFNGLTTLLEGILAPYGISSTEAGSIGAALIVGGIFGSALIPALSDKFHKRKPFMIACIIFAIALTYPLGTGGKVNILLILGAALGFFFLPAFALLLEMCAETAGDQTGSATGLLMLCGNAGGVAVIGGMEILKGDSPTYIAGVIMLVVLLIIALIGAFFSKETYALKSNQS